MTDPKNQSALRYIKRQAKKLYETNCGVCWQIANEHSDWCPVVKILEKISSILK